MGAGFNEDGNLDVVFANNRVPVWNSVCLGNGDGDFECGDVSGQAALSYDVAVGDVNNDGHLDAVFTDMLCLGDGMGGFGGFDNDGNLDPDGSACGQHRQIGYQR